MVLAYTYLKLITICISRPIIDFLLSFPLTTSIERVPIPKSERIDPIDTCYPCFILRHLIKERVPLPESEGSIRIKFGEKNSREIITH